MEEISLAKVQSTFPKRQNPVGMAAEMRGKSHKVYYGCNYRKTIHAMACSSLTGEELGPTGLYEMVKNGLFEGLH
jgi:hypothetical protein